MKKLFLLITLFFAVNCLADPVHEAARRGDLDEVKRLIEEGGDAPLSWAVRIRTLDLVPLLVLNGAEIDQTIINEAKGAERREYLQKIHDFVNANPQVQRSFIKTYFASQDYTPFIFVYAMKQAIDKILKGEALDPESLLLYDFYVIAKNSAEKNKAKAAIVRGLKIPKNYSHDIDFDAKNFRTFLSKALRAAAATKNRMLRGAQEIKIFTLGKKIKKYPPDIEIITQT